MYTKLYDLTSWCPFYCSLYLRNKNKFTYWGEKRGFVQILVKIEYQM